MLTVAVPKRNKLQNIIVLTPKDGPSRKVKRTFAHSSLPIACKIRQNDV